MITSKHNFFCCNLSCTNTVNNIIGFSGLKVCLSLWKKWHTNHVSSVLRDTSLDTIPNTIAALSFYWKQIILVMSQSCIRFWYVHIYDSVVEQLIRHSHDRGCRGRSKNVSDCQRQYGCCWECNVRMCTRVIGKFCTVACRMENCIINFCRNRSHIHIRELIGTLNSQNISLKDFM